MFSTARLTLREMTDADLDDMALLLGDTAVMGFYPRSRTSSEAQAWIDWNQRLYRERGFGLWFVTLTATGEFVGDCGLTVQRVDGVDEIEVGYHVRPELQGHGYATEAAAACRDLARDRFGVERLIAIIDPGNAASQAVARKIGLSLEKHTTNADGVEQLVYSRRLCSAAIRRAGPEDAEQIADIWYQGWRDGHLGHVPNDLVAVRTEESFGSRAAQRIADTVVAVVDDHVAGFVMVIGDEVEQVYVSRDSRGSGVAAILLAEAERLVSVNGHQRAWLAVVAGNTRARRFYERCGWIDDGPFVYPASSRAEPIPVPCHRYVKDLTW